MPAKLDQMGYLKFFYIDIITFLFGVRFRFNTHAKICYIVRNINKISSIWMTYFDNHIIYPYIWDSYLFIYYGKEHL
jgi:hypothetical protein